MSEKSSESKSPMTLQELSKQLYEGKGLTNFESQQLAAQRFTIAELQVLNQQLNGLFNFLRENYINGQATEAETTKGNTASVSEQGESLAAATPVTEKL